MSSIRTGRTHWIDETYSSSRTLDCAQYDNLIIRTPMTGNITITLTNFLGGGRMALWRAEGEIVVYLPNATSRTVTFNCGATRRICNFTQPHALTGAGDGVQTGHVYRYRCIQADNSGNPAVVFTYLGLHVDVGSFV